MKLLRPIRSFVRRETKLSTKQQQSFEALWAHYGFNTASTCLSWAGNRNNQIPLILEIGFGKGHNLCHQAKTNPDKNYLGIEVYRRGVANLLAQLIDVNLANLKVIMGDVVDLLPHCLANNSLDQIQIFFPDPWPKTKHHKRRLVQKPFVDLLYQKLKPNGQLYLATDCKAYAMHMLEILETHSNWKNIAGTNQFSARPSLRPLTRFEERGLKLGHTIFDLCFISLPHYK